MAMADCPTSRRSESASAAAGKLLPSIFTTATSTVGSFPRTLPISRFPFASFTRTWNREAALGIGNDFTPNSLINAAGNQLRFTTWQAKLHGTVNLPAAVRLVPVIRAQSGTPYARTFVRTLNYGNAIIKAEPISANRTPTITLVDLRTEKTFRAGAIRLTGFFDLYNLFNTNAEQAVTTSSGASWLRPIAITGPRILRIGARFEW